MANTSFDVIVIGVGSMGSSACYFLARQGYKVLGLEQFDITHEYGAHTGQSRIIRKAYFESPDYVPLLKQAYKNWKDFEDETDTQLYYRTGLVYFGKPDKLEIKSIHQSASLYDIPLENLSPSSAHQRFPQFKLPPDFEILFEPDAGFIPPEKTILLYAQQAIKKGAEIHSKEKVLEWKKENNDIVVITDKNKYHCGKLIITAGPWAGRMIPVIAGKIKVTRQFIAWIKPRKWEDFMLYNFPCWMIADDERPGMYYGFPALPVSTFGEPQGLKLAHHYPGIETDPDHVNRKTTREEEKNLEFVLNKYFPGCFESVLSTKTCLYANTPDENFIIDYLPGYEKQVAIACGFSGHGFKFVSVVGEILTELITEGKTKQPIGFLNASRFTG